MLIKLQHPFLGFNREDFSKTWIKFCLRALKIHYKANMNLLDDAKIGFNIYFENQYAFLCIAEENGKSQNFDIDKIRKQYKQSEISKKKYVWKNFMLCVNYKLTGNQLNELKKELPEIAILDSLFFEGIVNYNHLLFSDYFKPLLSEKNNNYVNLLIPDEFNVDYPKALLEVLNLSSFEILIWCNSKQKLYPLRVNQSFKISDVLNLILKDWPSDLPKKNIKSNYKIIDNFDIVYQGIKQGKDKTLKALEVEPLSIFALNYTIKFTDIDGISREGNFIY